MLNDIPKHLQLFADQAKDIAIVFLDADGDIEWFSHGAERLFGYTADEMVGQPIARLFTPEDVANGLPDLERAIAAHDGTSEDDRWMQRKDGSRLWASGAVVALRDEQRQVVGYGKMLRDRTEVREQVETLRNLLASAEAASARKDVFLSTLSHELRNPLAPLLNADAPHRLSAVTPGLEQPLASSSGQIDVLRRLIDDLLEVARIHTGKIAMKTQPVSLHELLDEVVRSMAPAVERKRQHLELLLTTHDDRRRGRSQPARPGVREPRDERVEVHARRAARSGSRRRRRVTRAWSASRTPAWASRPRCCRGSSTSSRRCSPRSRTRGSVSAWLS
jgi:PAS domain S-box-containing protein